MSLASGLFFRGIVPFIALFYLDVQTLRPVTISDDSSCNRYLFLRVSLLEILGVAITIMASWLQVISPAFKEQSLVTFGVAKFLEGTYDKYTHSRKIAACHLDAWYLLLVNLDLKQEWNSRRNSAARGSSPSRIRAPSVTAIAYLEIPPFNFRLHCTKAYWCVIVDLMGKWLGGAMGGQGIHGWGNCLIFRSCDLLFLSKFCNIILTRRDRHMLWIHATQDIASIVLCTSWFNWDDS